MPWVNKGVAEFRFRVDTPDGGAASVVAHAAQDLTSVQGRAPREDEAWVVFKLSVTQPGTRAEPEGRTILHRDDPQPEGLASALATLTSSSSAKRDAPEVDAPAAAVRVAENRTALTVVSALLPPLPVEHSGRGLPSCLIDRSLTPQRLPDRAVCAGRHFSGLLLPQVGQQPRRRCRGRAHAAGRLRAGRLPARPPLAGLLARCGPRGATRRRGQGQGPLQRARDGRFSERCVACWGPIVHTRTR